MALCVTDVLQSLHQVRYQTPYVDVPISGRGVMRGLLFIIGFHFDIRFRKLLKLK